MESRIPTSFETDLRQNEDWLMERILSYAKQQGYTAYTSTLKEAWRLSISGLTMSIIEALHTGGGQPPELTPEEDFSADPAALFGVVEAQRHRERGISLEMFMGLMKYYRQSYIDLVRHIDREDCFKERCALFLHRVFDRVEIGFCMEWSNANQNRSLHELQVGNRLMTNEKNKYLTIFESIPSPVIILNRALKVDNMNISAARLFKQSLAPGSQYYCLSRDRQMEVEQCLGDETAPIDPDCFGGVRVFDLLPWLKDKFLQFQEETLTAMMFEKKIHHNHQDVVFRVKLAKNLDVSGKFEGTIVILEDITTLKKVLAEVKMLKGLLPICSSCKKIRDEQGYWTQIESYIKNHSEADFTHSICTDCAKRLYPDLDIDD